MINEIIKARIKEVATKTVPTIIQEPRPSLPINAINSILENLPAITELYKELREGKRIELSHERAMKEIELQNDRWDKSIQRRCAERDKIHNSLKVEIEKAEDISHKLAFYKCWVESLGQPLVLSEEVNSFKVRGDEK